MIIKLLKIHTKYGSHLICIDEIVCYEIFNDLNSNYFETQFYVNVYLKQKDVPLKILLGTYSRSINHGIPTHLTEKAEKIEKLLLSLVPNMNIHEISLI